MALMDLRQIKGGAQLQSDVIDLQAQVHDIKNIKISNKVKLTGTIGFNNGQYSITFNENVANIRSSIQDDVLYNLYYMDNSPVFNENADNLQYDIKSGTLLGIPSIADPNDADISNGVTYIPVEESISFKMFAIMDYSLETLPADSLLDDDEFNALVYSQTLNELVVSINQNTDSISSIQKVMKPSADVIDRPTAIDGQTVFTLSKTPTLDNVKIIINSVTYFEPECITVDRTNKKITWIFTSAVGGFDLLGSDEIKIEYKTNEVA